MSTPSTPDPDDRTPEEPTRDAPPAPERTSALGPSTGQHAAARPYPPSSPGRPEDALTGPLPGSGERTADRDVPPARTSEGAGTSPVPTGEHTAVLPPADARTTTGPTPTTDPAGAPVPAAVPSPAAGAVPVATRDRRDLREEDGTRAHPDLPERPRKPGVGRHLLGTLLGLLLTPLALLLVGIGTARLSDVAGSGDPATDALGLTLLILGTLLLAVIVLLGAWSPAVPVVGGLVWGIGLGVAYLVVPDLMSDTVDSMVGDRVLPAAVEQLTESAVSGQLLVTGTLLLVAGVAAARARRNGRLYGHAVATADAARAEAARHDRAVTR